MATFSETQITDLAAILETNSDYLSNRLGTYREVITEADKAKVLGLMATWETAGNKFTSIEPNTANFGARINPGDRKDQIKKQIAGLLQCSDIPSGSGLRYLRRS